jgi:predicted dehydrogenase
MKEGKKIRVGVIGLGMGRHHVAGYREHPECEVVAIADPDPVRLAEQAGALGIPETYTSGEELIDTEKCDVISIATPNKFHKALTIRALRAGAHVLCEKPMAMNAAEAREMLAVSDETQKRIMINFSYRFTAQAQALKARVDAGDLGDAYYGRTSWLRRRGMPGFGGWFGDKALAGGGPLIDLGVHRIDLALWFMSYPEPEWIMGATYDPIATAIAEREGKSYSVEDLAAGFIRFRNGATLSLEASWAANIRENELMETRILGTKGGLVHRNVKESYEFEAEFFEERAGHLYDSTMHTATTWGAGARQTKSAMHHFVSSILAEKAHDADGRQGLVVMEILDALYKSAYEKKPVRMG